MTINPSLFFGLCATWLATSWNLRADVTISPLFTTHAVLQRDQKITIWGGANEGEKVSVQLGKAHQSTVAQDGKWRVTFPALPANSKGMKLTVKGNNEIVIDDILIGDVWLASGQSNMERQLGPRQGQQELIGWREEAARAHFPQLRQFAVPRAMNYSPQSETQGSWSVCSPETAPSFTAVGYYFARDIQQHLGIPIGILFSSWGGTMIESWISEKGLATQPKQGPFLQKNQEARQNKLAPEKPNTQAVLYNAMIAPLQEFAIKGVIWYQGESNRERPAEYRDLLSTMVSDWRQAWKQPKLPFLYVQVAPFNNMTPLIREAQLQALPLIQPAAMVVTIDIGDAKDIHPTRKEPVGQRLALAARAVAYGEKIAYQGPNFLQLNVTNRIARVKFEHVGKGLLAKDGALRGFTIAGEDQQFQPATASIVGDEVHLEAANVEKPVAVRYGWDHVADGNLFNSDDLPASPFRTDSW